MPYKLDCNDDGCYVVNTQTGKRKNKKRMPKSRANKYMRALYHAESDGEFTKKENYTGAMIAFFVPKERAKKLAIPVGIGETEPLEIDDLHITLCYLGDIDDDNLDKESIEIAIERFTQSHSPVYGIVNGYGRFDNEGEEKSPIFATFDAPDIPEFRQELVEELEYANIEYKKNHGFTPHITLAYFPTEESVNLPEGPDLPIRFDSVVLSWGNEKKKYHLQGEDSVQMKDFIEFLFNDQEEIESKELSLDDKLNHIRDEIRRKFNPTSEPGMIASPEPYYWVQYIYESYAIVNKDEEYFRVDYSVDEDENVLIGSVQKVEMAWVLSGKEHGDPLYNFKEDPKTDHFMVSKDKSGNYRWIMFSSNAFQDRDGEIVSLKALTDDVARADEDGDYGPLRWWHIGEPDLKAKTAGPGLDIGKCDFNAMHGKILIESGTFRDQEVGEIIAEKSSELQGSILFFHPVSEPDDEGVFHNIHRAERSLLPKGKASNSLVSLLVSTKESEMNMVTEKVQNFIKLLGGDEEKVKEAIGQAELTEKEALELGITWKGEEPEKEPEGESTGEEPEGEKPEGEEPEGEEDQTLGDLTQKQFQEILQSNLGETVQPLAVQLKEIQSAQALSVDTSTSMKEVMDSQAKQLKTLAEKVEELEGETPRGQKGYRASQDDDTVIGDDHALKEVKPGIDPEWQEGFFPGSTGK